MTAAAALLFCAGALALLCLTPLDLSFRAEKSDAFSSDIRATWLFGLVKKRFRTGRAAGDASSPEPRKAAREERTSNAREVRRKRKRGKGRRRALLAAMKTPGFPARLVRFAGHLFRSVLPRQVSVRLEGGFEDPATTGMAVAAVAAVAPALRHIPRLEFAWDPNFELHEWKGRGAAHFRLVPGRLIWTCARFACHPVTVRAIMSARRKGRG
jgi:uncharacterized membrane protein